MFSEEGFRRLGPRAGISARYLCQVTHSKREHLFEGMCDNTALENQTGVSVSACLAGLPSNHHLAEWGAWCARVAVHEVGFQMLLLSPGDVHPDSRSLSSAWPGRLGPVIINKEQARLSCNHRHEEFSACQKLFGAAADTSVSPKPNSFRSDCGVCVFFVCVER